MAKIDSRGLVDDGSQNLSVGNALTVAGAVTVAGAMSVVGTVTMGTVAVTPVAATASGSVTLSAPGYYTVAASGSGGAGYFTGSVPSAKTWPGSTLVVTDTAGIYDWQLTGSSFSTLGGVFVMPVWASGTMQRVGTKLSMPASGSVAMISDGYRWLLMANTGSITLSGLPT
jgi:hypothetical protein